MTAAIGAVVRRTTGVRPAITGSASRIPSSAPASEARPAASSTPAHPSLAAAILAMFAVFGAPPPDDTWQASWITPPRR